MKSRSQEKEKRLSLKKKKDIMEVEYEKKSEYSTDVELFSTPNKH